MKISIKNNNKHRDDNKNKNNNLLFISLSNKRTLKNSVHADILDFLKTKFDTIFVFCWDKKEYEEQENIHYFGGNFLSWRKALKRIPKINQIYINDFFVGGLFGVYVKKTKETRNKRTKNKKTRLVLRCGSPWRYELDSLSSILKTILVKITKPIVIKNCNKVVYNSKAIVQKQYRHNWDVVYNGVDTELFRRIKTKNKNFNKDKPNVFDKLNVLYIGRVRRDKGLDYLFKAAKGMKKYCNFGIVGVGDMLNEYGRKFSFAKYYGKIKRTELPKLINKYDVVVLPSLHNSAESFPNVLLEAMACEKPVIGTNVHGIPEMIISGVNGFLIPQKSSLAIRKAVSGFIEDFTKRSSLIKKMGKKGRQLVKERFEKEKQVQKLYNVLLGIKC